MSVIMRFQSINDHDEPCPDNQNQPGAKFLLEELLFVFRFGDLG